MLQVSAVEAAKRDAEQVAAGMRQELESKLADIQRQAAESEKAYQEADEQVHQYHKHISTARREMEQLNESNRRTHKDLLADSSWRLLARDTRPIVSDSGS